MLFTGEYEHTIDAQGRVAIPSDIRNRLDPEVDGSAFYAVPGHNGAIWLWPEKQFEALASRLDQSILPDEDMSDFETYLFSQARRLDLDPKTGRIRLPEQTLQLGRLSGHVVIIGVRDHLELRDPAEWEQIRAKKFANQTEILLRARAAMTRRSEPDQKD